jgi:hypothetical protein
MGSDYFSLMTYEIMVGGRDIVSIVLGPLKEVKGLKRSYIRK